MRNVAVALAWVLATSPAWAQGGPPAQSQQQPPAKPGEEPVYEEQVVVTASKIEQQLVNAPATVSVVSSDVINSTPSTNYAELFKSVPGVNLTQTSARDFNITMRGAASTLATSTLALLDGRSLYLDFFGFVAWDLLPVNPAELKQIEVVRGPGSAVWGANAMNGVVNFISKTPRELNGNSATIQFGAMNRDVDGGQQLGTGQMFGVYATHARAVNDKWAYKISAGGYTSDALARPTGNHSHYHSALHIGITREELIETIIHVGQYAGWPTIGLALRQLNKVIKAGGSRKNSKNTPAKLRKLSEAWER